MTTKQKSLSVLRDEADKLFSEIIRKRDVCWATKYKCVVCLKYIGRWQMADAAHVFDRDNMATRYDEHNVWATCRECNRFDPNHREKFKDVVRMIMGKESFEALEKRSRSMMKFTRYEMVEMIEMFKLKLKQ
jgi:hypothetical protein